VDGKGTIVDVEGNSFCELITRLVMYFGVGTASFWSVGVITVFCAVISCCLWTIAIFLFNLHNLYLNLLDHSVNDISRLTNNLTCLPHSGDMFLLVAVWFPVFHCITVSK
jgi:hypothetical protein